jgi:MFS family permease
MVGSIAFSFSQTTALGVISITVLGLISGIFTITHMLLLLLVSPPDLRGRILGLQSAFAGLFPLGSLLMGITADNIGLAQAVRLFAVVGLALLVIIWFRYPELRESTR